MTAPMVLLPLFVQVGLTFVILFMMATARTGVLASGQVQFRDIALRQPNWPEQPTKIANCFSNQFELPVLFYVLVALALPLRRADMVVVLLSWVFVLTRLIHAGIFLTSNDVRQRSLAWFAGALILLIMWIYFAAHILLAL